MQTSWRHSSGTNNSNAIIPRSPFHVCDCQPWHLPLRMRGSRSRFGSSVSNGVCVHGGHAKNCPLGSSPPTMRRGSRNFSIFVADYHAEFGTFTSKGAGEHLQEKWEESTSHRCRRAPVREKWSTGPPFNGSSQPCRNIFLPLLNYVAIFVPQTVWSYVGGPQLDPLNTKGSRSTWTADIWSFLTC